VVRGLIPQFVAAAADPEGYQVFVKILTLPESVTGYREIRYPKMVAARQQAEVVAGRAEGAGASGSCAERGVGSPSHEPAADSPSPE